MQIDHNTRTPVTPGAMDTLRQPTDVDLSPEGQRIAFVLREPVPVKRNCCLLNEHLESLVIGLSLVLC